MRNTASLLCFVGMYTTACYLPQQQGTGAPTQPAPAQGPTAPPAEQGGAHQSAAPAAPQYASFTLRNTCRETVKLFFGDKPKFGSGKSSTIGGNSQQSESMKQGDMLWIIDDSGNGVTSHTISGSEREVAINGSCNGFEAR
jgi:hypothetical protein